MSYTRRQFLRTAIAGTAGVGIGSLNWVQRCSPGGRERPNILWLDAEDLSPDIGCYGNPVVHTPNLDQLASDGVRFTNAFTSSPVCSPSRSAIITGMHQTTIGAHNHRSHRDDEYTLPEPVQVITRYFREAGYFCCRREFADRTQ
ncbi:MAG TPA: sulfatase-like hydrolase/transferase, partial [bacterium]|nr:sulfatase-like hydrolase/transferase [bacterium]